MAKTDQPRNPFAPQPSADASALPEAAPQAQPSPAPEPRVAPSSAAPAAVAIDAAAAAEEQKVRERAEAIAVLRDTHYEVFDLLAVHETRAHWPVERVKYDLSANTPRIIPKAHALKFLCDAAFVVRVVGTGDHDPLTGDRIQPLPKIDQNSATGHITLTRGQIIVLPEELTESALRARVGNMPGVDPAFVVNSSRDQLVTYIYQDYDQRFAKRRRDTGDNDATDRDPNLAPVGRDQLDSLVRVHDPRRAIAVG